MSRLTENAALRARSVSVFCASAALLVGGCHQKPPAGTAPNMQAAFKNTDSNVRDFADQGVVAESKGDFGTAFVHYRALSLNPELTQEQRDAASKSMVEMNAKLRDAAKSGDTNAEKVLENYRATK